jgi:alanyl-tRNA synthetase
VLDGRSAFDLYATYGLPFEIARDIAREQNLEVDEPGFRSSMETHRIASGGGKAMGKMGGEDADFYAGVFKELQRKGRLDEHGVAYDPYTSPRVEGELLALIVNGQSVTSATFGDPVGVILPRTGLYIESGGQVADQGLIRSLRTSESGEPAWEIEVTDVRRPSAGVIVHVGEVIAGQPRVSDQVIAEVDMPRRHDVMRNHTATHLLHAALHAVLGEHARQAGSLVAPDRLRFDFNHPEAMTPEQVERVEKIVNDAVAADMQVLPKLKARADAISEGAMALFGEKYGETVRTITITPLGGETHAPNPSGPTAATAARPTPPVETPRYSYELCGGTHLDRTSDVGLFLIVGEGSAAAGVRRIEALTGRGAYALVARRFRTLEQAAAALKSAVDDVPVKVQSLQEELAAAKRDSSELRKGQALTAFDEQLSAVQKVGAIQLLTLELPEADIDTLRSLGDKFRDAYPNQAAAILATGSTLLAVVTPDLAKSGLKAADLIKAIGGRGGGRPGLAQGSLPEGVNVGEALSKAAAAIREGVR